jgi:Tfp pilus assembly protein PilX
MRRAPQRQRGATLLIVLIMLIMLTLFAISAMNTGNVNLKVVGNMQARSEALGASMSATDTVLSTTAFVETPANAVVAPCGGVPNTLCLDVNGDGTADYTTTLNPIPACVQSRAIKVSELVLNATSEDLACTQAQQQGSFGVAGAAPSGDSLCGNTTWEITAQTLAAGTNIATSTVNVATTQGIAVRVKALDMVASCP